MASNLEQYSLYVLLFGIVVTAIAALWMIVRAFRVHWAWGVGLLLFPPSVLLFIPLHFRKAWAPLLLFLVAGAALAAPYGLNYYYQLHPNLGPREKIVDGEVHVTLTGWNGTDYSVLQTHPDIVVLQIANADVNDATLDHLKGMQKLRELDLNDTAVTDAGLAILAGLPQLRELRLARTKITDEGFAKYLAAKESLRKLDLTGTPVKGKTKRLWKQAQPGRDYVD
jgi:hypothetical protein